MNKKSARLFEQIIPFLVLGVAIALAIELFIIISYVVVWGIVIGGALWLSMLLKQYLFPTKPPTASKGRIIEHDDENK